MIRPDIVARLLVGLLGLATLMSSGPAASADRETAEFMAKRGERLLKENDAAGAAEQYRRSIDEDAEFLPAHVGLGDALVTLGRLDEAAAAFRAAIAIADKTQPLPPAWTDLIVRARRRLTEADATGSAFEGARRRYADALVALAEKWKTKDPALAERALALALEAVPDHPAAKERLGAAVGKGVVAVFDGKAFDGTVPDDPYFKVVDGILKGGASREQKGLISHQIFDADIDVRMEARMVRRAGDSPKLAIVAAGGLNRELLAFGTFDDAVILDNQVGDAKPQRMWTSLIRNLKPGYDPMQWTKYEIRLRGDAISLYVNGVLVRNERRPKDRQAGVVGVLIQDLDAEVRLFEVVLR